MYDVSIAWLPWIGAAISLRHVLKWKQDGSLKKALELAKRLAELLNVDWGGGVLVCVPVQNTEKVRVALTQAKIKFAVRAAGIRFSTHVCTTEEDITFVSQVMKPFLVNKISKL